MEKKTLFGLVLAAILVTGAVFVSANLKNTDSTKTTLTLENPEPETCGCGCNNACNGNCGLSTCSCSG